MQNSDEIITHILENDSGLGSIYKAMKILKESIDGEENDMSKAPSSAEISQVIELKNMNRNLEKLNKNMEWLMAAIIASSPKDTKETLIKANELAHHKALGDNGMRF